MKLVNKKKKKLFGNWCAESYVLGRLPVFGHSQCSLQNLTL